MLGSQRHLAILKQLTTQESVSVRFLEQELGVSGETIRTDLIQLEQQGKLQRIRGGARGFNEHSLGLPLPERAALNREEKATIARKACSLIRPRDTVFLDASSTVLTMKDFFPDLETTVITNANHVVVSLGHRSNVDMVCTGGEYEQRSRSYVGILAEEAIQRYYIHWLFIGVDGIDSERGPSEVNPGQAHLKERIIPLAEKVCVLADHTKLQKKSAFFFARPDRIDLLITDHKADPLHIERFQQAGIKVLVCSS